MYLGVSNCKGIILFCGTYVLNINITRKEDEAMEGSGVMATRKLSYAEQLEAIAIKMQEKIDLLHSLPEDEASVEARKNLQRAGMMDDKGNLIGPYAGEIYVS